MNVSLISVTPKAEDTIMYIARVSNPNNQSSGHPGLLRYCIKHGHWSIFEHAYMTVEIVTSRAIAAQILRHRSFTFQEYSQRYAEAVGFEIYEARRQDAKNRQNSIDDMSEQDKEWFAQAQVDINLTSEMYYKDALARGIAKEQARFLLPLSTQTKLYMTGNLRSWLHYIDLRTDVSTQKEHRDIALAIKDVFKEQCPIIAEAKGWV
jgi:thymidylate synthase (FAD)